ncbi:DinB family protein [Niallia sp. 03133]|uniref:DinB family protein n=1 Tax=Niallia sp. 03133 TaxID=3458060 RepID=UPI004044FCB3
MTVDTVKNADTVPSSAKEMADAFCKVAADTNEAVKQQWTDQSFSEMTNVFGRNMPKAATLSLLIKHINHHRGQMTVLMRQYIVGEVEDNSNVIGPFLNNALTSGFNFDLSNSIISTVKNEQDAGIPRDLEKVRDSYY